MNTKTLLTMAIILALPLTANAAYTYNNTNTPAAVANNGTVTQATASGPYVTATIGDDDDEHIASTAYVKGAYNDSIAAVNKVKNELNNVSGQLSGKQRELVVINNEDEQLGLIDPPVISSSIISDNFDIQAGLHDFGFYDSDDYREYMSAVREALPGSLVGSGLDATLLTADAVFELVHETEHGIAQVLDNNKQTKLTTYVNGQEQDISPNVNYTVGLNGLLQPSYTKLVSEKGVVDFVNAKRVEIYTTWDDDTAKTEVAFVTAQ